MRHLVAAAFVVVLFGAWAPVQAAPILLGTGTLRTTDDLTRIHNGDGTVTEWLDLTSTAGLSVSEACALYGSLGFHWASGVEVASLYGVFGIPYGSAENAYTPLNNVAQQERLMEFLGVTYIDGHPFLRNFAALGWIDDLTSATNYTFSCLSRGSGGCLVVSGYVQNLATLPKSERIGTYLSRTVQVPEPSSILLFSLSTLCLVQRCHRRLLSKSHHGADRLL